MESFRQQNHRKWKEFYILIYHTENRVIIKQSNLKFKIFDAVLHITGHPALIARHRPFPVTHEAAERWLLHMQQALDNISDIDHDSKIMLMNFFRFIIFPNSII